MSRNIFSVSNGDAQSQTHPERISTPSHHRSTGKAAGKASTGGNGVDHSSATQEDQDEDDCNGNKNASDAPGQPDAHALSGGAKRHSRLAGPDNHELTYDNGVDLFRDRDVESDTTLARRLSLTSDNSADDFDLDLSVDPFQGQNFNDETYASLLGEAELSLWRLPDGMRGRQDSTQGAGNHKRVHFEEDVRQSRCSSISSSSDDEETEHFPDLFMDQENPLLKQRLLEMERDDLDNTFQYNANGNGDDDDAASVWDFDGADEALAFKIMQDDDSDSDDDSEDDPNSEDETMNGDETDEESEHEQIAQMRQLKNATTDSRQKPVASATPAPSTAMPPPAARPKTKNGPPRPNVSATTPAAGKLPRAGTFVLDPTRASMHVSTTTGKLHTRPPSQPLEKERDFWQRHASAATSRNSSPRSSFSWNASTPMSDDVQLPFMSTQSTLRTMFDGSLSQLYTSELSGIAGDLDPLSLPVQTRQTDLTESFGSTTMDDDSDMGEEDIDVGDFMHVDDSDSEDERPTPSSITSPGESPLIAAFGATAISSIRTGPSDDLLSHLHRARGVVGSFRRNQHAAKMMGSMASHPDVRASTSEMNAFHKGRRGAANTPMTPARKKRVSQDMSVTGSGVRKGFNGPLGSPLASKSPRRRGHSINGIGRP